MERNIDFDQNIQVDSLKDALWRLSTRVYLLEDFIAERFGEVLGPTGFTKSPSPIPDISEPHTSTTQEANTDKLNVSSPTRRGRKRRRPGSSRLGHASSTESEDGKTVLQNNQAQRSTLDAGTGSLPFGNQTALVDFENSEADLIFIPKQEISQEVYDELESRDDFLHDKSDDDDGYNDSVDKDPDFIPFTQKEGGGRSQHSQKNSITKSSDEKQKTNCNRVSKREDFIAISIQPDYCIDTKLMKWSDYYTYVGHTGSLNILWQCNQCSSRISVSFSSKSNAKRHYLIAHETEIIKNPKKVKGAESRKTSLVENS